MYPLLSTNKTNPSYLSFNQLKPYCVRLNNILLERGPNSQRERVRLEQQLWTEIKLVRNSKDQTLLNYLVGFYHSLCYQIAREPSIDDLFQYNILIRLGDLHRYKQCDKVAEYYYSNARNLFPLFGHAYNQLALMLAKPEITPENYYKCCYYYARAAKSSERSLETIAESNLRVAARAYDGDLLFKLLNGDAVPNGCEENPDDSSGSEPRKSRKLFDGSPKAAIDWFYVLVVAIYADNVQPAAKLFLDFTRENFALQRSTLFTQGSVRQTSIYCDRDAYLILASLDILLDWLKLGSQTASILSSLGCELRKIRSCLRSTLASLNYESNCSGGGNSSGSTTTTSTPRCDSKDRNATTPTFSPLSTSTKRVFGIHDLTNSSNNSQENVARKTDPGANLSLSSGSSTGRPMALPHDYTLQGFKPLDQVHSSVTFCNYKKLVSMINEKALNQIEDTPSKRDDSNGEGFIGLSQLKQILHRITCKMDGFGERLKRKSRNIALESILANNGSP